MSVHEPLEVLFLTCNGESDVYKNNMTLDVSKREKILPRSLSSSSVCTPSTQWDGPHSSIGSLFGGKEREKKVHICESVNCIWPLGGRSKSKSEPQPLMSNHVDKNHKKMLSQMIGVWSGGRLLSNLNLLCQLMTLTAVITFHFLNREINDHKVPS